MNKHSKIYVAGHNGMVGSAIVRQLVVAGYTNIIVKSHHELDLTNFDATLDFLKKNKPDYIFMAAARVGGIYANNTYRAEFLYQNLMIASNMVHAAWLAGINDMLFLGSSCIYPRDCLNPIKEEYLLSGPLEITNEPYALAKIAGIKLCENYNLQYGTRYVSLMPTNLYGPNDNYDLNNSHVLPGLIRKTHEAKNNGCLDLVVWGTGVPRREFLYVDDLANACLFIFEHGIGEGVFNVGSGVDYSINELAHMVMDVIGFKGNIVFDTSKPDGTLRKLLDNEKLTTLGWQSQTGLYDGIIKTYEDFIYNKNLRL